MCSTIWQQFYEVRFVSPLFPVLPVFILILGLLSLIVSIYGLCAAASKNKNHLFAYSSLLGVVFLGQFTSIFLAIEIRNYADSNVFAKVPKN